MMQFRVEVHSTYIDHIAAHIREPMKYPNEYVPSRRLGFQAATASDSSSVMQYPA